MATTRVEGIAIVSMLLGIATIVVSSWVINDYKDYTARKNYENLVSCAGGAVAAGIIQLIASSMLFKGKLTQRFWIWIHMAIFAGLIVCFSIPMHDHTYGQRVTDAFVGILACDFILIFLGILWIQFKE